MFMVIESGSTSDAIVGAPSDRPEGWLARLAAEASAAVAESRGGDVYRFVPDRAPAEIVLGFRPGVDRIVIMPGAGTNAARLLTTEQNGSAVVIDGQRRRIVIQGVKLDELRPGDIELAASA